MVSQEVLSQIRSMPHLHLFDYRNVDGAAMHANFAQAVWEQTCFVLPTTVSLSALDEYQFARAEGTHLNLANAGLSSPPQNYEGENGLIDWLMSKSLQRPRGQENSLLTFEALAIVVYAAEICVADVSTEAEHFRQVFYQGRAISPCARRRNEDLQAQEPLVQLQFTLGAPVFKSSLVHTVNIKTAIQALRLHHMLSKDVLIGPLKSWRHGWQLRMRPTAVGRE